MNYFAFETAAKRYAAGRPFFHPIVRDAIRDYLGAGRKVAKAIDVACGSSTILQHAGPKSWRCPQA